MAIMQCTAAASRMRKEYGEKPANWCGQCCNCQAKCGVSKVCIAWSDTLPWNEDLRACGLFNVAFRGLRPRRRPLHEMFEPQRRQPEPSPEQSTMF